MRHEKYILLAVLFLLLLFGNAEAAPKHAPNIAKSNAYDSKPFDLSLDKLNRAYKGHNLYAVAIALARRPIKDEYETSTEYEKRLSTWEGNPLVGGVKSGDIIAIRDNFFSLENEYNADTGVMSFHFNRASSTSAEDTSNPYVIINTERKVLPSVVGQTAMGIKFKYERKAFVEFGAKLTTLGFESKDYEIKVIPEVAKRNILWFVLYVGVPVEPYIFTEENYRLYVVHSG